MKFQDFDSGQARKPLSITRDDITEPKDSKISFDGTTKTAFAYEGF